jgi:PAS domain-containing protein
MLSRDTGNSTPDPVDPNSPTRPGSAAAQHGPEDSSPGIGFTQYRQLLDKLPAGAYLCAADGRITYYNQRAVELWGREPKLRDPLDLY